MDVEIEKLKLRIKSLYDDLKSEVTFKLGDGIVGISITEDTHIPNMYLNLCIDFEVKNNENEDNGLCLSVSIQSYDPREEKLVLSTNSIFVLADLTTITGSLINQFEVAEVDINKIGDIKTVFENVLGFIGDQKDTIISRLMSDYITPSHPRHRRGCDG
jgi:hypothetical protein